MHRVIEGAFWRGIPRGRMVVERDFLPDINGLKREGRGGWRGWGVIKIIFRILGRIPVNEVLDGWFEIWHIELSRTGCIFQSNIGIPLGWLLGEMDSVFCIFSEGFDKIFERMFRKWF